jgi:hypothetical protein
MGEISIQIRLDRTDVLRDLLLRSELMNKCGSHE